MGWFHIQVSSTMYPWSSIQALVCVKSEDILEEMGGKSQLFWEQLSCTVASLMILLKAKANLMKTRFELAIVWRCWRKLLCASCRNGLAMGANRLVASPSCPSSHTFPAIPNCLYAGRCLAEHVTQDHEVSFHHVPILDL